MIHTQYYAFMRGLSKFLDTVLIEPVVQWDFNYNSIVVEQLKKYGKMKPYPKGQIAINNVSKQPTQNVRNFTPGMYIGRMIKDLATDPLAQVRDKFAIYGLFNWYTLDVGVTLRFETSAQMLDAYHSISENIPLNFIHYAYDYAYYVSLDHAFMDKNFDPFEDETDNIYAYQMKDDSSNFQFFTLVKSVPLLQMTSITQSQDTKSQTHQLNLTFSIRDRFLFQLLFVDMKYFLQFRMINFVIAVEDFDETTREVGKITMEIDNSFEYGGEPTPAEEFENTAEGTNNDTAITDTIFQEHEPEPIESDKK